MQQKIGLVFAFAVGLVVAWYAYQRATDPAPGIERARQERIVLIARELVRRYVAPGSELEIVDPLAPNRVAGKSYIYPTAGGWEVSGHYRRNAADTYHPWLMHVDGDGALRSLAIRDDDPALLERASTDARLSVLP